MSDLMQGKRGLVMGLEVCQEKWEPVFRSASRPTINRDRGQN